MDPDISNWDNIIEVAETPNARLIFEVPLTDRDLAEIEPAAIASGLTLITYLKHAALRTTRLRSQK